MRWSLMRDDPGFSRWPLRRKEKRQLHFPDSLALGVAYRRNDRLTLAFDVTRTDWNDFYVKTEAGRRISMVDGSDLDDPFTSPKMDPAYTARFGVEYVFVPKRPSEEMPRLWSLRGGLFYDEEPATGKENRVLGVPEHGDGDADSFHGFTFGAGLLLHHRYNLDVAYQFRRGKDVNRDFFRGVEDFHENVVQHRVLLSAVIYF